MPAILASLTVLAVSAWFGGWPWTLVAAIVLFELCRGKQRSLHSVCATAIPSLLFLAIFAWTRDRRLFFPYSMQYAAQLACLWRGRFRHSAVTGGVAIITVFIAIRIVQDATPAVLAVEIVVAIASVAVGLAACGAKDRRPARRAAAALLASLVAYAGLLF